VYLQSLLCIIAAFIVLIPAFVTRWRTDAVLKGVPEALQIIFENGISNQVTSLALIISAMIQAKAFYLSGYHAIIVLNLSWILTLSMCCSLLTAELYEWRHHNGLKYKALIIEFIALFGAVFKGTFSLWVFVSKSFVSTSDGTCHLPYKFMPKSWVNVWRTIYPSALLAYALFVLLYHDQFLVMTLPRDGL